LTYLRRSAYLRHQVVKFPFTYLVDVGTSDT